MKPAAAVFRSVHADASGFTPRAGFQPFDLQDAESTLGERFREVARRRGSATAVVDGSHHVSYAELLQRAEALARDLRSQCGTAGGIVAICLPSHLATIETILGALLGEFGYFCIDASISTQQKTELLLAAGPVALQDGGMSTGGLTKLAPAVETRGPTGVAALYATSGSTGRPKMVALSHRAVLFDIGRQTNDLCIGPDDRLDSLSSFAFSASLATIFGALLNGAELHCYDPRHNFTALPGWLTEHRITVSTMTVSMLRHLCLLRFPNSAFSNLRLLSVGGEALHRADVDAVRARFPSSCVLQNAMAATETRTYAQYFVPRTGTVESPVPIGWPVAGKDVELLDESGAAVPDGSEGEIAVRSRYLADGYVNDAQQTAMKFQAQPNSTVLYRTGDRGLFRRDGCLIFLGRTDSQAKVRGHRVELDHVAQVIGLHPQVATSVVTTCADSAGNERLVAYVVARPNSLITNSRLRDFLRDRLPAYAVPATFVYLPELPLNANFKVDRRRLPPPQPPHEDGPAIAGGTIEILRELWKEALQRSDIPDDESFADLGGDSLSTIRSLVAIHERFGLDLPPDSLQRFPTLKLLADCVDSAVLNEAAPAAVSVFRSGGTGCSIFFVAGLGGSTSDYEHIGARLGSCHSVYGLNARSRFSGGSEVSVEAIAANHIAEIEKIIPPNRTIVLVGHSFGGTIAFEIARQLHDKGFLDALPIVIDMPAVNAAPRSSRQRLLDILCNLPKWTAREVANFHVPASLFRAYGNVRRVVHALLSRRRADKFDPRIYFGRWNLPEAYQAFLTSMYRAMLAYVPRRYEGRMILLRAKVPTLTRRTDLMMGWQAVAVDGVEVHSISGGHDDCVSEHHGRELASVLLRCLASLESAERKPG